jgi:formylglycine-generating enzyme required for sulfatase activity
MVCVYRVAMMRALALSAALVQSACAVESSRSVEPRAAAEQVPLLVEVPAGTVVDGFQSGRLRQTAEVSGFRITQHPVTREQFEQCVGSGVCKTLEEPACQPSPELAYPGLKTDAPDSPALCVGRQNAESYCRWVGGTLPTLRQWLYAARGTEPTRYAWGNEVGHCDHHPRFEAIEGEGEEDELVRTELCAAREGNKLLVAKHAAGASPFGVQDVLIAHAELLSLDAEALVSACDPGFAGCMVTSSEAGVIESARALEHGQESSDLPYGFRCALEEN